MNEGGVLFALYTVGGFELMSKIRTLSKFHRDNADYWLTESCHEKKLTCKRTQAGGHIQEHDIKLQWNNQRIDMGVLIDYYGKLSNMEFIFFDGKDQHPARFFCWLSNGDDVPDDMYLFGLLLMRLVTQIDYSKKVETPSNKKVKLTIE